MRSRRHIILIGCLSLSALSWMPVNGQSDPDRRIKGLYLGPGLGQDAGGLGARLTYWVNPAVSVFAGGGWALVGGAYNAGGELRLPTKGRVSPFATAMYGYNAVIKIEDRDDLGGIYYGATIGAGIMVQQSNDRNYWRFSINVPFRSEEF